MKTKYIALGFVLATAGILFSQSLKLPKVDGIPTKQGEKGSLYAGASEDTLWIKAGGNSAQPWVKFNFVALGGAVRTSVTLTNGAGTYTNSTLSTNASVFVTPIGTNAVSISTSRPDTNGVVNLKSSTTNSVSANLLILD